MEYEEEILNEVRTNAKAEAMERARKKEAVAKSQIVFDIKVYDIDTDLEELATQIKNVKIENLVWGIGHKIVPLAFGICKLQVSCVILDDVSVDIITETLEEEFDCIQSIEEFSFNKL